MSRTQLAFNSGDLAFQEIITSRPNVNSATRVVSRNAVWPVTATFPSTPLYVQVTTGELGPRTSKWPTIRSKRDRGFAYRRFCQDYCLIPRFPIHGAVEVTITQQSPLSVSKRLGCAEPTANRVVADPAGNRQQSKRSELNGKITHQKMELPDPAFLE